MLSCNENDISAISFCQLKSNDFLSQKQYEQIAGLIYGTDPYIYPAMFACDIPAKEAAIRILPEIILAGEDEMFRKENFFLCLEREDIVGIILWYKGILHWNARGFLNAALQLGINLSEANIEAVGREYVDKKYSDNLPSEGSIALINVCVDEKMRGKGIGRKMMAEFIGKHFSEKMELCVLADNSAAVKLYQSMGFKIIRKAIGFSLTELKPNCFDMVRSPVDIIS